MNVCLKARDPHANRWTLTLGKASFYKLALADVLLGVKNSVRYNVPFALNCYLK
jgi:hypothetical protein